ncbi:MAG TPA: flavodoxin domain-containing protein [Candidatus Dormibacteraeota bacterium]|nr:flavodoxin domain-containing protein [Candidatus Dormibacteraeota bacterium]
MRILVVYASKYGSTKGIAERIADTLNESGQQAAAVPASKAGVLDGYDAFVIGSAAYMGSWLTEAAGFVRRNAARLRAKPVWLFSSGPIGTANVDAQGRDVREATVPKEIAEFRSSIEPRDHRVFFGAFDHTKLNFTHRLVYALPAMKSLLTDGDFRDWDEIESWAKEIAAALVPAGVG